MARAFDRLRPVPVQRNCDSTAIMALYARYPIAQAPGMGENFFLVFSALPAATAAGFANGWQVALGVVFVSRVLFLASRSSYSIADGLALGFISYAVVKGFSGRAREISWLTYLLAIVLVVYFVFVRSRMA